MTEVPGSPDYNYRSRLEGAPASEYKKALKHLTTFIQQPLGIISHQHELDPAINGVGKALSIVIRENGAMKEVHHPSGIFVKFILDKSITEEHDARIPGRIEAFTDPTETHISIEKYFDGSMNNADPRYSVEVPINNSLGDEAYEAVEYSYMEDGSTNMELYIPSKKPADKSTQQQYARLLKLAVEDILAISRVPTEIPSEIADQFKEEVD